MIPGGQSGIGQSGIFVSVLLISYFGILYVALVKLRFFVLCSSVKENTLREKSWNKEVDPKMEVGYKNVKQGPQKRSRISFLRRPKMEKKRNSN